MDIKLGSTEHIRVNFTYIFFHFFPVTPDQFIDRFDRKLDFVFERSVGKILREAARDIYIMQNTKNWGGEGEKWSLGKKKIKINS